MYIMNLGRPTKVSKLNEDMAIELGANLMGEVLIFSVAGGCLLFEYSRQQTKETNKEQARQEQLEKFTSDIQALYEATVKQESEIKYLNNVIEELNKKVKVKVPPRITENGAVSEDKVETKESSSLVEKVIEELIEEPKKVCKDS